MQILMDSSAFLPAPKHDAVVLATVLIIAKHGFMFLVHIHVF